MGGDGVAVQKIRLFQFPDTYVVSIKTLIRNGGGGVAVQKIRLFQFSDTYVISIKYSH